MENLLAVFRETLLKLGVTKNDRLLLAVSGGLDSVVLTTLCAMADLDFSIAHANFHLRGDESNRDQAFVQELARRYNKQLYCTDFDTSRYAELNKCSIQVAARELRYNWFKSFIGRKPDKFQFLLTAHHLDDSIETMLMHFFRGTGISGLSGIPEKNEQVIRPLLSVSKNQLQTFASFYQLKWVEDSSNYSDEYTRNFFRNQLIPSMQSVFPNLHQNLEKNLQRFSDVGILYRQAIQQYKKKLVVRQGSEIHIPILLLKKTTPLRTIMFEILKDYHFTPAQAEEAIRLMDSTNGKYIAGSTHRIIKNRRWFIVAPLENTSAYHIVIEKEETVVGYPDGRLHLGQAELEVTGYFKAPEGSDCLDMDNIKFPLLLRKWKAGDYFYPLGMKKKKKVARFLIDQKLSRIAKEKVWVLISDSQILWVVGHRIDNRFRVSVDTKNLLIVRNETDFIPS